MATLVSAVRNGILPCKVRKRRGSEVKPHEQTSLEPATERFPRPCYVCQRMYDTATETVLPSMGRLFLGLLPRKGLGD